MKNILLTGGTGYIGSHITISLLEKGYNVIIVDNLSNSNFERIEKIKIITGREPIFHKVDINNLDGLENVFKSNKIDAVIHLAGLKNIGESCNKIFDYYENNICGSINLLKIMDKYDISNIIFSSSTTIYNEYRSKLTEESAKGETQNPYSTSKYITECILSDLHKHKGFNVINLRYFNPIGAHESGLIYEDKNSSNLIPTILNVVSGELEHLNIFGKDYNTKDGTCERDYIHIDDLVDGHLKSLKLIEDKNSIHESINLGTGKTYSVLDIINITETITKKKINYKFTERRSGDYAKTHASTSKAETILKWKAKYSIEKGIKDHLKCKTQKN